MQDKTSQVIMLITDKLCLTLSAKYLGNPRKEKKKICVCDRSLFFIKLCLKFKKVIFEIV